MGEGEGKGVCACVCEKKYLPNNRKFTKKKYRLANKFRIPADTKGEKFHNPAVKARLI